MSDELHPLARLVQPLPGAHAGIEALYLAVLSIEDQPSGVETLRRILDLSTDSGGAAVIQVAQAAVTLMGQLVPAARLLELAEELGRIDLDQQSRRPGADDGPSGVSGC